MNRAELLAVAKPILFNTPMVQAILDGGKTETRRVIKLKYGNTHIEIRKDKYGKSVIEIQNDVKGETYGTNPDGSHWHKLLAYIEEHPPYKKGDILYVRETWNINNMDIEDNEITFEYKASEAETEDCTLTVSVSDEIYDKYAYGMAENMPEWRPSIHMPKEAARIFLRVTSVRAERLRDITKYTLGPGNPIVKEGFEYGCDFIAGWENTIPKKKRKLYGYYENPWVWVIEFERISANG